VRCTSIGRVLGFEARDPGVEDEAALDDVAELAGEERDVFLTVERQPVS
jgi:hypothetical protein